MPILLNPPASMLGRENAILRGFAFRHEVAFEGPASIKTVVRGAGEWEAAGATHRLETGAWLPLNEGDRYALRIHSTERVETLCLFFRRGWLASLEAGMTRGSEALLEKAPAGADRGFDPHVRRTPALTAAIAALRRELDRSRDPRRIEECFLEAGVAALAAERSVRLRIASVPALRASTRIELHRRIARAVDFIHARHADPIDLGAMAAAASLSEYHFHRTFRAIEGVTPLEYLTRVRLDRARDLLEKTSLPIATLAPLCGFLSPEGLARRFRSRFGIPPARHRRNSQDRSD
ncbi:MAG TPA: AraC family transcriptional regulator [Thermoanaerobaculia bacterium]|nr:AraC family transcriptional regulator [Thermoanaerobaculia bacterium]